MTMNNYIGIFITLLYIFLLFPSYSFAVSTTQSPQDMDITNLGRPAMTIFKDKDGLPQNTISLLAIDSKGYLWVVTRGGIVYYNGHKWTNETLPNKISSDDVQSILATADGSVWFGTVRNGLCQFKDGKWATIDTKSGLPNNHNDSYDNQITSLLETKSLNGSSNLWVGTGGGLVKLEGGVWKKVDTSSISSRLIAFNLLETKSVDGNSIIWVNTENELLKFEDDKWIKIDTSSISSISPRLIVRNLLETKSVDGSSILWAATGSGLLKLENNKWTVFDTKSGLPSNLIECLLKTKSVDGSDILWVGTEQGLVKLEHGKFTALGSKFDKSDLLNKYIFSLLEMVAPNGSSILWVGTESGLVRLENELLRTFDTKVGLPNNTLFSLVETKNSNGSSIIWVGTKSGLAKLENEEWTIFDTKSGLPSNIVFKLLETKAFDGSSIIWAGTVNGLAKFENGKWSVFNTKFSADFLFNPVYNLLESKTTNGHSILWVGTENGLAKLEDGMLSKFSNDPALSSTITSLLETKNSNGSSILWVGTDNGLVKLEDGKLSILNTKSGLPSNVIKSLHESKEENGSQTLWVGTDSGVCRLNLSDPSSKWEIFSDSTKPALPNNIIYQILEDNRHRIYFFTNKGVARLTKQSPTVEDPSEYSVYTLTIEDGLLSNQFNPNGAYMIDSKERIWAGTVEGIVIIDPSQKEQTLLPKPLYIESASLMGSEKKIIENEVLLYNQNNIVFEYALLNLIGEHKTLYKTQLVGFDEQPSKWSSDYKKTYTNLSNGSYIFKVWAKDYLGNITGPTFITFKIKPALWYTWWAYIGYFIILSVAISGAGYSYYNYSLQLLEKQNKVLETKVIERTEELDKKNKQLADNFDELRVSKQEVDNKNKELDNKNEELAEKISELDKKNKELIQSKEELVESYKQAERIFSALADALPGTVLDNKYRLENKIGSGGFGAVYRATHLILNHFVAVKIFRPTADNATTESLERFRLEGISACRVNHPNAISVLDFGISSEGIAYLVMELLDGYTLDAEIKEKGKLSLERSAKILIAVCDVLYKAHESGIIHRDIKPSNIFIHNPGVSEIVKVLDFGIAKLTDNSKELEKLTITGNILGTPTYMSPERLSSKPYDGRSDVYSVGILLYEMLCGSVPFESGSHGLMALVLAHIKEEPRPLREIDPAIPENIESLVLRTLSKDPNLRPTAKELAEKFAEALGIECNLVSSNISYTYQANNPEFQTTVNTEQATIKFGLETQE